MNGRARFPKLLASLALALGLALGTACAGCRNLNPVPTATQPITDELSIYRMLTDKYTDYYVIFGIDDMPASEAGRIVTALQGIDPPPGLEELHQQAIRAFVFVRAGKLLVPGADSELRAEAYFQVDWGIKLLIDYRQQLDSLSEQVGRPAP